MGDQRTSSLYQISPALIIPKYLLLRELVQSAIFPTNGGHWIQKKPGNDDSSTSNVTFVGFYLLLCLSS